MLQLGTLKRELTRSAALLAIFAVAGCSVFQPEIVPETAPEIVIVPQQDTQPEPPRKPPEPPRLPPVAIVLTSSQPAYQDVAHARVGYLDDFSVFNLSDSSRPPVAILRAINDSDSGTVVAIGLRAARSSVALANAPVIFSQVFNYQDYKLLTKNSRGVAPLAPLDAQLAAWTEIEPGLSRIGIIVGEGHDELLEEAQLAAQKHNVELHIRIAHSDQETLYIFRRMVRDIDGFWLFPDNRVLSARALKEMLDSARRLQVSVAVPNESMLAIGASISMATQAEDIAATIAGIIRKIQAEGLQGVPAMSPLSAIRVVTSDRPRIVSR